jgi:hypothetical protein
MFHYRFLGGFTRLRRPSLLQSVAVGYRPWLARSLVANRSQAVISGFRGNICLIASGIASPIPLVIEGHFLATMSLVPQLQRKTKTDLVHLRSLPSAEPATSTGRVAWVWPEIQAGLATGKKLKEVWEAVQLDGLDIPYPQFRVYVSRLRRRERARERSKAACESRHEDVQRETGSLPPVQPTDPYSNLREQQQRKQQSGFEFDPFSNRKDLIG